MHPVPEWAPGTFDDANNGGAHIFRTEYQTAGFGVASFAALHDHEAGCAVCQIMTQAVQMVPGTRSCPPGMTMLYEGYLMAERHTHIHSSQFVCVDKDAEPVPDSQPGNEDGALLYPTETEAPLGGTGYGHDNEARCAVCAMP
jgi:hypothetical protein